MKKSIKTLLCTGVAATLLFTSGYFGVNYTKKWVNNKVQIAISQYEQQDKQQTKQDFNQYEEKDKQWTNQNLNEAINNYGEKDKQWTSEKLNETINQYGQEDKNWTNEKLNEAITQYGKEDKQSTEQTIKKGINNYEEKDKQWTKQTFEAKLPLEEIAKAFNSTYMIVNWGTFKTTTGEKFEAPLGTGSGILLEGGYFLTARHVTNPEIKQELNHPVYGPLTVENFEYSITGEKASEDTRKTPILEKLVIGSTEEMDYALLKLKEPNNMIYYKEGIQMPKNINLGMTTIAIGFPLAMGRNIRMGNVSQTESDLGENCITYKNDILPSDSGGPLFIIENGQLKLAAISIMGMQIPQGLGAQYININAGIKMEKVIEDLESQLKSGKLDQKTAEELENFLKLNKK